MNRRDFGKMSLKGLAPLLVARVMVACGIAVGTFVSMGLTLISTVLPTIPGILAAFGSLTGKTISAAQVAQLTAVFQGVADLFRQAETALNQFNANNDPTLIAKIQDILGQVKTSLGNVLADIQIKDPATLAKITSVVNSFVDLANNILTILPQVINGKLQARKVSHAQMAQVTPEGWSSRFNQSVGKPTGNNDVDLAFSNVRAVVPPAR
jgi:hypothetical protein